MPFLSAVLRWTPRGAIGFVVGAVAVITIFVNALFMQSGLHPAPLLKPPAFSDPIHRAPKAAAGAPAQPAPAPVTAKISHASRAPSEMIMDIQQELAHRGYYDGPVDGLYGPRTEGAIRDFERAASLTPSALPSEALLHACQAGKRSSRENRRGGPERVRRRHSASADPITGTGLSRATRTERIRLWPDQANWNS